MKTVRCATVPCSQSAYASWITNTIFWSVFLAKFSAVLCSDSTFIIGHLNIYVHTIEKREKCIPDRVLLVFLKKNLKRIKISANALKALQTIIIDFLRRKTAINVVKISINMKYLLILQLLWCVSLWKGKCVKSIVVVDATLCSFSGCFSAEF